MIVIPPYINLLKPFLDIKMSIFKEYGTFKGSTFLKNSHYVIQERINKLIYSINTIINVAFDSLLNFI